MRQVRVAAAVVAAAAVLTAGGCGAVNPPVGRGWALYPSDPVDSPAPDLDFSPAPRFSPSPVVPALGPTPSLKPLTPGTPTPTFAEAVAVPCGGRPTGEQVVAAIRRVPGLLPAGAAPKVSAGPLCAGQWQYTVLTLPDVEPLQVVTRGVPTALAMVTAGTNVCTIEVTAGAPPGILSAARC